jgi:hypothetical protein
MAHRLTAVLADKLAKKKPIEVPPNQCTAIPFSVRKKHFKEQLKVGYQARWAACTSC